MYQILKKYLPFFLTSLSLIIIDLILGEKLSEKLYVFTMVVLVGGLPHGALDFFILKKQYSGTKFLVSLIVYLVIAASIFVLFYTNPLIIFLLFLAYSAFHFGDSDFSKDPLISRLGWGSLIISLPLLISTKEALWFTSLFIQRSDFYDRTLLLIISSTALMCSLYPKDQRLDKIVIVTFYLITIMASNIFFAFASYFTALHSVHHLKGWIPRLNKGTAPILGLLTIVILGIVAIQLTFDIIESPNQINNVEKNAVYTAITMLGALTVPHMILINRSK